MQLPKGATVAVADGEKFNLFRNDGDEAGLKLVAVDHGPLTITRSPTLVGKTAPPIPTRARRARTATRRAWPRG